MNKNTLFSSFSDEKRAKKGKKSEKGQKERKRAKRAKIAVVQQVMGHTSNQATLGYLRNLEVPVLKVDDMPAQ